MVTLMFRSPMEACSMKNHLLKLLWSLSTCTGCDPAGKPAHSGPTQACCTETQLLQLPCRQVPHDMGSNGSCTAAAHRSNQAHPRPGSRNQASCLPPHAQVDTCAIHTCSSYSSRSWTQPRGRGASCSGRASGSTLFMARLSTSRGPNWAVSSRLCCSRQASSCTPDRHAQQTAKDAMVRVRPLGACFPRHRAARQPTQESRDSPPAPARGQWCATAALGTVARPSASPLDLPTPCSPCMGLVSLLTRLPAIGHDSHAQLDLRNRLQ